MNNYFDYFKSSPGISLLFAILLMAVIIMQCLTKKIFYKVRFVFAVFITASITLIFVFYNQMLTSESEFWKWFSDISLIALDVILAILLFTSIDFSFTSEVLNKELTKTIDESRSFVLLDKKDKIREISTNLASSLKVDKAMVYGKNFFDVVEINNKIVEVNGEEVEKEEIKKFYSHYKRSKDRIQSPFEITVIVDDKAERTVMFFTENNIFKGDKYKGRILYGNVRNENELVGLEKDMEITSSKLDNIKNRLSFIISKTEEGLYFYNVTKKEMWFNDVLVKKLSLNSNSMSANEFISRIHPSDIEIYTDIIKKRITDYEISYRFNAGAYYLNVTEKGRKIVSNIVELCGIIEVNDNFSYEKTYTLLDKIQTEEYMKIKYQDLIRANQIFEIAYFKVSGIPEINEKYGRAVGNEIISHFVYRFMHNYIPENLIYRVGGLEFVGFLTNVNRIAALREHLLDNEDKVLTISLDVAGEKVRTMVYLGLALSKDDERHQDMLLDNARKAMKFAESDNYKSKYVNYKDIK